MRRPLRSDEARSVANLAIDLGDPGRMSRARRMHRANGVAEVEVLAGVAHASVTDTNGEIHEVSIATAPSHEITLPPTSDDLEATCTCDDGGDVCTHVLASLLGIAEEVEANGRLLEVWAGGTAPAVVTTYQSTSGADRNFFDGKWASTETNHSLTDRRFDDAPQLLADDLDAGPVILSAIASVRKGLSRYRAQ